MLHQKIRPSPNKAAFRAEVGTHDGFAAHNGRCYVRFVAREMAAIA